MTSSANSVATFSGLFLIKRDPATQVRDSLLYMPRGMVRVPMRDKTPFSPARLKLEESMYLKHHFQDISPPSVPQSASTAYALTCETREPRAATSP
jgi:hypothetical protein